MIVQELIARKKTIKLILLSSILTLLTASLLSIHQTEASTTPIVSNWWPSNNASITGTQPFKGVLNGWSVNDYSMYWSVDGGQLNLMPTNYQDAPHKETSVNVGNWNWHSSGQYQINFIAQNNQGKEIARTTFNVSVPQTTTSSPTASPASTSTGSSTTYPTIPPATQPAPTQSTVTAAKLYVDPNSAAKQQADAWRTSQPAAAAELDKIAAQAEAQWFGSWNTNISDDVSKYVAAAAAQSATPVLVAYNIPERDCGGYSAGGLSPDGYLAWVKGMAAGIGTRQAMVILEPDSIANLDCLSASDQATRLSLLSQAVTMLKANSNTQVYLDGGNAHWKTADVIASRLKQANIAAADGFSLNVSNFYTTTDSTTFGQSVAAYVGNKHFVIDTSRNGLGPTSDNQWCNPAGRALGDRPSLQTSNSLVDAYLWIKAPGESDGTCNGGPSAGSWWADYALGLAQRAAY